MANEVLIRWLVPTAFCEDGQMMRRNPGDEDIRPLTKAQPFVVCGMCEIVDVDLEGRRLDHVDGDFTISEETPPCHS